MTLGAGTDTLAVATGLTETLSGIIGETTPSQNLVVNSATATGTLVLSNLNTYSGTTTLNGGTLSFNTIGLVGGGASSLGAPTTVANGTIALPGTLLYTGAGSTTDRGD